MPEKQLRAASYCRTSGETQRDNTSIPSQKEQNEACIKDNGWKLHRHYVDESKSGAKIEGREAFQQLLRDAANGLFDVVVVYDISRFARNGADIISNANFLKQNFGIQTVDTKGQFDTHDRRNTLTNFIHAGVSEDDRLRILERTFGGRIRRAKQGLIWCKAVFGRDFNKKTGEWTVSEKGLKMRELLERYVAGEQMESLAREYGFASSTVVHKFVNQSQLSGTYKARFHHPEIDIVNLEIPVPQIPEVISPELERKVRERQRHKQTWNKDHLRKYLLTGFIQCGACGAALTSQKNGRFKYYRHTTSKANRHKDTIKECGSYSVRADLVEQHALDYLFSFFLDQPAFDAAIKNAMPSDDDREKLEKETARIDKDLSKVQTQIANLVNAIAAGADASLMISKQDELKHQIELLKASRKQAQEQLDSMPDKGATGFYAKYLRLHLFQQHFGKDWRELSYDDVRKFLRFLFGDNPRKHGKGIFVKRVDEKWNISFMGNVEFDQTLQPGSDLPQEELFWEQARAMFEGYFLNQTGCESGSIKHQLRERLIQMIFSAEDADKTPDAYRRLIQEIFSAEDEDNKPDTANLMKAWKCDSPGSETSV